MTTPLEPLPIYSFYLPIVVITGIVAIRLSTFQRSTFERLNVFSSLRAFFAKQSRTKTQRIKPGVKYQWDPDLARWVPVLKRPSSVVKYTTDKPSNLQPSNVLTLSWPLATGFVVTQTFQEHLQTKIDKGYKYYNGGLDLAYQDVREGEPVLASAAGVLQRATFSAEGYGNVVYIDHLNGYVTIYAHLSGFGKFVAGEAVESYDVIGYLGHTGNCEGGPGNPDGTHLHFELRYQGTPVDSMPFIQ